jgi:drug/metabolite transporter (DMT)-like permease
MSAKMWAAIGLLSIIWGLPYFLIKVGLTDLSPACVAWGRVTVGALVMLPLAWRKGALRDVGRHRGALMAFALADVVGPFLLISWGETWISSSLTAILNATAPLIVVVIQPWFGAQERIGAKRLTGFAVGFAGVVALVGIEGLGNVGPGGSGRVLWGAALVLLAAVGYSIGPLVAEHKLRGLHPVGLVAASLGVASLLLAVPAVLTAPDRWPSWKVIGAVATLGSLCSALALVLFVTVVAKAGTSRASVIAYLAPMVAVALGVVVLGEPFGWSRAFGMGLILGGSWLAAARNSPPSQAQAVPEAVAEER